jgi:membrane associated rhomboid family serine protease
MAIQTTVATAGGPPRLHGWFEIFGLSRDGFLSGKIWQVASYGLLHGAWWHAGLNALVVLLIGSRIEHMAGHRVMARTTLAGVVGGGAGHLLLGSGLLVGLSGGCMALLLLLTTLSPQSRMWPLPVSGKSLGLGLLLAALLLTLMNPALALPGAALAGKWLASHGLGGWFQVGHACHLVGGLAGWLYGRWLLRAPVTLRHLRRDRARREARG